MPGYQIPWENIHFLTQQLPDAQQAGHRVEQLLPMQRQLLHRVCSLADTHSWGTDSWSWFTHSVNVDGEDSDIMRA